MNIFAHLFSILSKMYTVWSSTSLLCCFTMQSCIGGVKDCQLPTCLNLTTTRHNSCLPLKKELSFSISYLHQSLLIMFKFHSSSLKKMGFTLNHRLTMNEHTRAPTTVYPVCGDLIVVLDRNRNRRETCLHYCLDMLL